MYLKGGNINSAGEELEKGTRSSEDEEEDCRYLRDPDHFIKLK